MSLPTTYAEFLGTLENTNPPEMWPEGLKAMWWDACDNWHNSHNIAQHIPSDLGHWIHAYLHRKEGDQWNAGYWYRKADREYPVVTLEEEAKEIVVSILNLRS